jgi:hypothetical protein
MTEVEKLVLKFFNKVLKLIEMDEIKTLTDFKDVDRKKLINPKINDIIEEMHPKFKELLENVKKTYYKKEITKEFNLVYMRALCKGIDMKFSVRKITRSKNSYLTTYSLYSITSID